MKFQKGMPRPANAGRKKGSTNIKRVPKVADYLADNEINPAAEIVKILQDPASELKDKEAIDGWVDLLSYCQAKPLAEVEPTGPNDSELLEEFQEVSTETLLQLVKSNEAK